MNVKREAASFRWRSGCAGAERRGLSLLETMMALVVLGVAISLFFQTTRFAQRNAGKSEDWQLECAAMEKAIERLRGDHTVTQLQSMDSSWIDSSQGVGVAMRCVGGVAPSSIATTFPAELLAQLRLTARRAIDTASAPLEIVTLVWVN